jgi:hypothetical protein
MSPRATRRKNHFFRFWGAVVAPGLLMICCKNDPVGSTTDGMVDSAQGIDLARDLAPGSDQGCIDPFDFGAVEGVVDLGREMAVSDGPLQRDAPRWDLSTRDWGSSPCPVCMVLINNTFCIDRYEASRPDATATSTGTLTGAAQCKAGVIPWMGWPLTQAEAATACALADKRLCTEAEWKMACSGPQQTVYGYGNGYDPVICNGIDTYCLCGAGQACEGIDPCPYPHCFNMPPPGGTPAQGCGAGFHLTPTGALVGCDNGWGVFDMHGNVWEVIQSTDGLDHFRGGAFNCGDSETLHRCDYDATWGPSAQGFRCCADPAPSHG